MQHPNWTCPKCGHDEFETDRIRTTGEGLSRIFDVQNKKFSTVTCTRCKYTELYRADASALGNLFDFLTD